MLSKTIIAAAALAATASAYSLPTCWSDCFAQYELDSEGCLCSDSLGKVIDSCIQTGCSAANATAYDAWLASYCYVAPVSSNTWSAPSVTYSVPASSSSVYISAIPSYPVESSSVYVSAIPSYSAVYSSVYVSVSAVPSGYPSASVSAYPSAYASSSAPVYPVSSGYESYSVCTETATLIYRSSTAYSTYEVTHTSGAGGWGAVPTGYGAGSAAGAGWGAATGTGAAYPAASSWAPVPATGAGSKLAGAGLGAAAIVGGVAAVLL